MDIPNKMMVDNDGDENDGNDDDEDD